MSEGAVPTDLSGKLEEDESDGIFSSSATGGSASGALSTSVVTAEENTRWGTVVAGKGAVKPPSQTLLSFRSEAHQRQEELYW